MSKKCELTGKIPMKGHKVSHANNKSKRRFLPNLKKVSFKNLHNEQSVLNLILNNGICSSDFKLSSSVSS